MEQMDEHERFLNGALLRDLFFTAMVAAQFTELTEEQTDERDI